MKLEILDLGEIDYLEALELQIKMHQEISEGKRPSTLFLVEHQHVYTLGVNSGMENLKLTPLQCHDLGIEVIKVDRGGDIAYHGPGQIVVYPIINLSAVGLTLKEYVYGLEDMVVTLLEEAYGLKAKKGQGKYKGAFIGNNRIMAVGIKVKDGTTMHGFTFDVTTELKYFNHIILGGLRGKGGTSLSVECGQKQDIAMVKAELVQKFKKQFAFE